MKLNMENKKKKGIQEAKVEKSKRSKNMKYP